MKRFTIVFLAVFSLFIYACGSSGGGGGGNEEVKKTAPEISNLQYEPQSAAVGEGGGAVMVEGQIDYRDQEGNIATITISTSQGMIETRPVTGIDDDIYGMIQGGYVIDTTEAGEFTVSIYATDSTNLKSNVLAGTFTVF